MNDTCPGMKCDLDIIIVNWNGGRHLLNCIQSLALINNKTNVITTIVDNASNDGSTDSISKSDNVNLIFNTDNLGFAKACNIGAVSGNSEFILFLNPDAYLSPNSIKDSVLFMKNPLNTKIGICGIQLINDSGNVSRSCSRFPNALNFVTHSFGLTRFNSKLGHLMEEWAHDTSREVDHVIGAFFLVRRTLFEKLGGFDENFFVYLEDLDFSYRAFIMGYKTYYLSEVQAYHSGGGISNQVKSSRLFYSLRSRMIYASKHFSSFGFVSVILVTLLLEPLSRTILAVLQGSRNSILETWTGYIMLYRWLPKWWIRGETR
jgi:GT2 family glycosyltransferase